MKTKSLLKILKYNTLEFSIMVILITLLVFAGKISINFSILHILCIVLILVTVCIFTVKRYEAYEELQKYFLEKISKYWYFTRITLSFFVVVLLYFEDLPLSDFYYKIVIANYAITSLYDCILVW